LFTTEKKATKKQRWKKENLFLNLFLPLKNYFSNLFFLVSIAEILEAYGKKVEKIFC
jgi:hypothetical protein